MRRALSSLPSTLKLSLDAALGYAFKSLGSERIVCVLNENFGPASEQIFDLDHRRHPISYSHPNPKKKRKGVIESLAKDLETAILLILQSAPNHTKPSSLSASLSIENDSNLVMVSKPHDFYLNCNHIDDSCDLPDYQEQVGGSSLFPYSSISVSSFDKVNSEFYRQKMKRIIQIDSTIDFCFKIKNTNSRVLTDVKVYFDLPKKYKDQNTFFRPFLPEDIQEPPYRSGLNAMMPNFKFIQQGNERETEVCDLPDMFRLIFYFGKLQAQEEKSSLTIRLGATAQGTIPVQSQIFADEFSSPQQVGCLFHCSYTEKIVSLQDLEANYFIHEI